MLFYLPLESYVERYTYLMSSKNGWAETRFKELGVKFKRVDGEQLGGSIGCGVVLDCFGRNYYSQTQVNKLIKMIKAGEVKDGDVIYTEDFWTAGIESLFYIRHMTGIKFKIGCFIHAQSVDDTDFAWNMREWMRPIEQGFGKGYDFIITCSKILKKLCVDAGVGNEKNIRVVSLPYNSERLKQQLTAMKFKTPAKKEGVIFSSRFDDEKDPNFFLDLVEACTDIKFKLVNPRKDRPLTSNKKVMWRLEKITSKKNSNLEIIDTSNKVRYYEALAGSEIQFNCAHQDWVSWTLLEAVTFNCKPLYPIWKDFPLELKNSEHFLYKKNDLENCILKLRSLIGNNKALVPNHVVGKHDKYWRKVLKIMKLIK